MPSHRPLSTKLFMCCGNPWMACCLRELRSLLTDSNAMVVASSFLVPLLRPLHASVYLLSGPSMLPCTSPPVPSCFSGPFMLPCTSSPATSCFPVSPLRPLHASLYFLTGHPFLPCAPRGSPFASLYVSGSRPLLPWTSLVAFCFFERLSWSSSCFPLPPLSLALRFPIPRWLPLAFLMLL